MRSVGKVQTLGWGERVTVDEFIAKWEGTPGGAEKKNFPIFIGQLCELLGVAPPAIRLPAAF